MATAATYPLEADILASVMAPQDAALDRSVAQAILKWDFSPSQHRRIAELSEKAREGPLTAAEERELDAYLVVDNLVSLIKSRARQSLQCTPA